MKVIGKKLLERFDKFVKGIDNSDMVAIYHDSDPDGTCSAVIVGKAVERLTGKKVCMHVGANKNHRFLTQEVAAKFKKAKINKIICVDIACEEKPEGLFAAEEFASILIIDHHKLYNDLKGSKKITLIKPQLLYEMSEPSKYCASKLSYDLMSRHAKLDDIDWVAAVGLVGDVCSDAWPEFLREVFAKYNIAIIKDLFETKIGIIARMISSAEVYSEENISLCFDVLYCAKSPDDVVSSQLAKFQKIIEDEINFFITRAPKLAEFYDDVELVFYRISPKYSIKSPLCTVLGFKYPNKTVLVVTEENGTCCVSARRQDKKVAVNALLETATIGFESSNAGGHIVSAGAAFPMKYLPVFKKRVLAGLKKIFTRE